MHDVLASAISRMKSSGGDMAGVSRWRMGPRHLLVFITALGLTAVSLAVPPSPASALGTGQYGSPTWFPLRHHTTGSALKVGCTYKSPYLPQRICNDPVTGTPFYHPYWALDLAVDQGGAPVYAAGAGQVRRNPLPPSYGYGNHIVINHGKFGRTLYAHLAKFSVKDRAWVDENTPIGIVGNTGSTGGTNHLHFEYNDTKGGWGRSGSPNNPGQLKACHGNTLVTYPQYWDGRRSWQGIQWGTRWAYSDGTACGQTPSPTRADLVVHNPADSTYVVATSTGSSFAGAGVALSGWSRGDWAGLADLTGDGSADLVVHEPSNATFVVAVNDGTGRFKGGSVWLSGWSAGDWAGLANVDQR
jgi:hypothetical protein